nr:DivIVA domain-containing protein [uncultured Agathobaculum sp.]
MTVQEIQEIGFEKAVFGGYDMKSVDTFLERVAEEFASMQKENAAMKAKMKVLVDKIEEYRGRESSMGRVLNIAEETLDRAKQEADSMVEKAKQEADSIVTLAKNETADKIRAAQTDIQAETQKLEAARKSTIEFIARVSAVYQAQAKALVELAKSERLVRQPEPDQPSQQQPAQPPEAEQQQPVQVQPDEPAQVEDSTRKFDFGELKFGSDYDPNDVK